MTFLEQRSIRFWIGAAFLLAGVLAALVSTLFGGAALRGLGLAAFLSALAARFLSYELKDPGFTRARTLLVAAILTAILLVSLGVPDRSATPIYFIGAALVAGGAASDVLGLWRRRRLAG